jgi:hypothetical protein
MLKTMNHRSAEQAAARAIVRTSIRDNPLARLYATGRLTDAEMRAILQDAVDAVAALMSTRAAR